MYRDLEALRELIKKDLANMMIDPQQDNHETRHMLNAQLHESTGAQLQAPSLPPMSSLQLSMEETETGRGSRKAKKTKAVRQSHGGSRVHPKKRKIIRTKFSDEFKKEIVNRVLAGERPVDLVQEFNMTTDSMIYTWLRKAKKNIRKINKKRGKYKTKKIEAKGTEVLVEKHPNKIRKLKVKAHATQDALIYLQHARDAIKEDIVNGDGSLDNPVYLFSMLALRELEKRV